MRQKRGDGFNTYEGLYSDALRRQDRNRYNEYEKTRDFSFTMNTKLGSKATIDYKTSTEL